MKLNKLTPNLGVEDIKATIKFYQNYLDFELMMAVPSSQDGIDQTLFEEKNYVYALIAKDGVEIMLQQTQSIQQDVTLLHFETLGASVSFYMEIEGIEAFYQKIVSENIKSTPIKTAWYGMKEFYILDNNGYVLGFAEKAS